MMQTTTSFTTISAHTKMTTEKRGQDELFGRNITIWLMMFTALPFVSYYMIVSENRSSPSNHPLIDRIYHYRNHLLLGILMTMEPPLDHYSSIQWFMITSTLQYNNSNNSMKHVHAHIVHGGIFTNIYTINDPAPCRWMLQHHGAPGMRSSSSSNRTVHICIF